MSIIRVENAKKDYRLGKTTVCALRGVSLAIDNGEFLAIAGSSGSGKTTLLNLISGIEKPTTGKVFFEETELSQFSSDTLADVRARKIGFIFQNFNLLSVLTSLENVEYPLLITDNVFPKKEEKKLALQALDRVGLLKFADHRPMELSGGQRQRVAIARAMVTRPAIILADEPTANLDHQTGGEILSLMKEINQREKTAFVFSTHDSKVMSMATRIVKLWDGAVLEEG